MEQPNDLIIAMQNRDEKAFSQLYTMYSEAIYGIIYSIVLDENTSEELLQDVFIKVWNNATSYSVNIRTLLHVAFEHCPKYRHR